MRIGVVMPCYRVRSHVLSVIERMPQEVERIYVVDDACPDGTGKYVTDSSVDARVVVITLPENLGVGGAVIAGYRAALADGIDIVVKVDGDGQMDPALVPRFVRPIADGQADYAKGNRFFRLESLREMPAVRLFGNAVLSLVNKLSSGYWDIMDPTNGFTAVHGKVLSRLPLEKISRRYFFESDMLFRLGALRAVVVDVPMEAVYGAEQSNLSIVKVVFDFPARYFSRILKRFFYCYFLRDFNAGTIGLVFGGALAAFGLTWGITGWILSVRSGIPATSGTVMVAALPLLLGGHLLISALNFDVTNVPRRCLHVMLD